MKTLSSDDIYERVMNCQPAHIVVKLDVNVVEVGLVQSCANAIADDKIQ